ncbi:MAG: chaperonin [Armatimonadetes bacterium]|nr:chaperonin [Armatimonadota bacterium]
MSDPAPQAPLSDVDEKRRALRSNASAVRTIASAVEGTLGPKGLDVMLVDRQGGVTITNDGSTILGRIDAQHPASRLLIHGARAQDEAVGDGTTTATVLAAALIEEGVKHVLEGVPPAKVIEGMRAGVAAAVEWLTGQATTVAGLDDPLLLSAARISARGDDGLARLAVEAAAILPEERLRDNPAFRLSGCVVAQEGAPDAVFEGLIIDKSRMNRQMPATLRKARVLVVADALEPEKVDDEALATEAGFRRHAVLREEFEANVRRLVELGVNFVAVERRVDEVAEELLTEAGVMVLRRLGRRDLAAISEHCGARPVMRSALRRKADEVAAALGAAEEIAEDERLGFVAIRGGDGTPAATLLVGAGTAEVKEERLRIGHDAAAAVQAAIRGGVLPGGGAAEIGALPAVERRRGGLSGLAVYGADAVTAALKRPLAQIVVNAGYNPLEKVAQVVARQAATGSCALAIDCDTGEVADMTAAGIVDPAPVKTAALQTAAEIAEAILRIGVVIRMKAADRGAATADPEGVA